VTCPCLPTPSTPAGQAFGNAYQTANNSPPGTYSAQAYDATNFILAAIRAGNTTSTAINSYLASHSYTGMVGTLRFNAKGEINSPAVEAYQVQNGTINPVGLIS
jgi:branched-chain amino acid transport system substrate-binding protein